VFHNATLFHSEDWSEAAVNIVTKISAISLELSLLGEARIVGIEGQYIITGLFDRHSHHLRRRRSCLSCPLFPVQTKDSLQ
jgi:hypothetical protein